MVMMSLMPQEDDCNKSNAVNNIGIEADGNDNEKPCEHAQPAVK